MHETSNDNAGNQSTDDAVIEYLSKKGITDQTEKLALTRISSKMGISAEQAAMTINRLSAKNLIRKIYFQGKVGFELTPKGKAAIEALARAETARITKQLQEAIHEERKAKLRSSIIEKMKSIGDEWQNYQMPDRNLVDSTQVEAINLLETIKEMAQKQPFCQTTPQNYDHQFLQYKLQIETLTRQNSYLSKAVNNYAQIKNQQSALSANIESLNKVINKYEPVPEVTAQVNQLKTSLSKLKSIQNQLESFDKDQLAKFEELGIQLGENSKILETLKKPTHEFAPIKKEASAEKATWYSDPELPIMHDRKTGGSPLVEKCRKCGIERKSTSVNIG